MIWHLTYQDFNTYNPEKTTAAKRTLKINIYNW